LDVLPAKSVDVILEITVFQHISEEATKNYFRTSRRVLKDLGLFICQFLMNDTNPLKDPYNPNEGTVYYTHKEVTRLVEDNGLRAYKFGDWKWTDGKGSYWRLYVITPNGKARSSAKA
jgi:cyclopropane fatty-acyl-phospholipid synthase-like methyltransferase